MTYVLNNLKTPTILITNHNITQISPNNNSRHNKISIQIHSNSNNSNISHQCQITL